MGLVYVNITLKNAGDLIRVKEGLKKEPEIRQTTVQAVVDTGAGTLIINETMRQELGLEVEGERWATLANKTTTKCKYTEPVEVHWGNRSSAVRAIVMEGAEEVLLGAIPLEEMDLIVDPARQILIGAHGDTPVMRV
ncbi:MAG: retroviral-like aspartic protease family protein [Treponema sp.]|nr:retroviral-like aspartic protease family protein [Treponema sp.]